MIRRARHGFTLVELLIVIGILLLLLGIGTIGYMHIDKVAAEKATHTRLDICGSMLNEYETAGVGLSAVESNVGLIAYPTTGWQTVYSNGTAAAPAAPQTALPPGTTGPVTPPSSPYDVNVGSGGRTSAQAGNTAVVLQVMSHVPAVKQSLSQLPPSAVMANQAPPIIVDGWKNPIIYVPSGGLTNVYVQQGVQGQPLGGWECVTVQATDGRPFWASAGQDGDFSLGDDNVYSTEVVYHVTAHN